MKKLLALVPVLAFALSACMPAASQPADTPTPLSEESLRATAAVLSQQTLDALPSPTAPPSETPLVLTATETPISETPTETPNPILLTLTATLGTGTVEASDLGTATFAGTSIATLNPLTPTTTPQPLAYGTLPPHIPYGDIIIYNKANADAYISLRCVTPDGNVTILEYPVKTKAGGRAPAGKYTYVAWIGGRQFTGSFSLSNDDEMTITLFKDRITIKK